MSDMIVQGCGIGTALIGGLGAYSAWPFSRA
jgi:hypothetical protein